MAPRVVVVVAVARKRWPVVVVAVVVVAVVPISAGQKPCEQLSSTRQLLPYSPTP